MVERKGIIVLLLATAVLLCCAACAPTGAEDVPSSSLASEADSVRFQSVDDLPRGEAPAKDETLAAAQAEADGLWGYLATDGDWAVKPAFLGASDFSEGLAAVKTESEYHAYVYGYIDASGGYYGNLHPWFTEAGDFSCGLAWVTDNNSDYFCINREAALAFPERIITYDEGNYYEPFVNAFNFVTDFCAGYALVAEKKPYDDGYTFAIISDAGEVALTLDPKYCEGEMHAIAGSEPDENGYCIVGVEKEGAVCYGVINLTGQEVLPLVYDEIYPFSDGSFAVRKDGIWGFVDADGVEAVPFRYEGARPFSNGAAPVKSDGKWGLLDENGVWLCEPKFDDVSQTGISEGLLAVSVAGKWGYIDTRGIEIVPPVLDAAGDFSEGMAWFQDESGKYGFLNSDGEVVIEPQFYAVSDFQDASMPEQE